MKNKIYNVVIDFIKENGLNGDLTVSFIASKVGIAKGSIYTYFESKDQIILESILYSLEDPINNLFSYKNYKKLNFEESFKLLILNMYLLIENNIFYEKLIYKTKLDYKFSDKKRILLLEKIEYVDKMYDNLLEKFIEKGMFENVFNKDICDFERNVIKLVIGSQTISFIKKENVIDKNDIVDKIYDIILKILS